MGQKHIMNLVSRCADARRSRPEPSSLSLAVRSSGWRCRLRLPPGARGREGPKQFLGQYNGILQTDGYAAYDHIGGPKLIRAVCWSHSRRKFVDAVKLNPQDVAGTRIVKRIDDLFAIDAEARAENMDHHRYSQGCIFATRGCSGQSVIV
jgi:hypothetical protein